MPTSRHSVPSLLAGVALALFLAACSPSDDTKDCPEPQTSCDGTCLDLKTDARNCGACGNACGSGESCTQGACVPEVACGNGRLDGQEACDDGNRRSDDGCSAACTLEPGYTCSGTPSTCATRCGDGVRTGNEACDDGNAAASDGCSAACAVEPGYSCSGAPSTCATACGDGVKAGAEACDDGNAAASDGCSTACAVEPGFECTGTAPTVCATRCGDGRVRGSETCDDGNTTAGDGCNATCNVEAVFESEANETPATADVLAWVPARVFGTLASPSDVDVYRFTLTAVSDVRIFTDDSTALDSCVGAIDTHIRLLDADGTLLAEDDDGGEVFCSKLDPETDPEVTHLRPGTYYVAVRPVLFAGTAAVPYGLNLQRVATCGDGDRTGSETCDDGNTADGDTCNRFCQVPPTLEVEPNNTAATASGPLVPGTLFGGSLTPGSEEDYFRFTLAATTDVALEVFDEAGPVSCLDIDPNLALVDSSGAVVATNDDFGPGACPVLSAEQGDRALRRMAPGTWYVRVRSTGGNAVPGYTLRLRYEAVCGDGTVGGSEECDGGGGCTNTCERVAVCGDGFLDAPEVCEDGNTSDGDGCSRTCAVENVPAEVEPNGTHAEADARASGGTPVRITDNGRYSGLLASAADVDLYRVELTTPTQVRFETYHGGLQRCDEGGDTRVRLRGATGTLVAESLDEGYGQCSAITYNLAAGVHYVEVSTGSNGDVPFSYVLETAFLASVGAESEPNEVLASATALTLTHGEGFVTGTHPAASDVDVFRITVPAGGRSLRAEISEGAGTETCESNGMDSYLTLLNAAGRALTEDDDGGRGYCSRIDGLGPQPEDFGARNLEAGTYYLQVRSASVASGEAAVFNYRLSVTLR
jgi:cysteine-rich repeat protein